MCIRDRISSDPTPDDSRVNPSTTRYNRLAGFENDMPNLHAGRNALVQGLEAAKVEDPGVSAPGAPR
eukprot:9975633-Alexandrium_andersonii.AAC.1